MAIAKYMKLKKHYNNEYVVYVMYVYIVNVYFTINVWPKIKLFFLFSNNKIVFNNWIELVSWDFVVQYNMYTDIHTSPEDIFK